MSFTVNFLLELTPFVMCEVETTNDQWVHALDIYIYIYILFVFLAIDKDSGNYSISSKSVLIVLV